MACLDLLVLEEQLVVFSTYWAHEGELLFMGGDGGVVFCLERAGRAGV